MKRILYFVTHNAHKAQEIASLLSLYPEYEIRNLSDLNFTQEIPETADSLQGNALLKAQRIHKNFGVDCFADDTGLEVVALNGAPGVYSARYAGEDADFNKNIDKLLAALNGNTLRNARFRTVIALILNGEIHYFEGISEGEILYERQGSRGFGYDAVFRPKDYDKSFAELSLEEKNGISHRGRAIQKMIHFLIKQASL